MASPSINSQPQGPITLSDVEMGQVLKTLLDVTAFLTLRDRMNAAIHCQDPRWSPITEQVHETLHMLNGVVVAQRSEGA